MSYESTLLALAEADPNIVVLTAENRAHIRSLPEALGARFIDVGIAEQTLVGVAAGLALRGRKPVVHALAPFLTMRAFEFIRTDVGIGRLPVKLVGFVPGFLSDGNGATHQSLEDIALMRGIPGMQVFCPENAQELEAFLPEVIASPAPCYVRYTAKAGETTRPAAPLGSADVRSEGRDVTLISFGLLVEQAEIACEILRRSGLSVGLINLRWLSPVDEAALLAAARHSRLLMTIEDHFQQGGLYSLLCELLVREGVRARVLPHAFDGRWFKPGTLERVLDHEGFSGQKLAARALLAVQEEA
ncbi:MAG TPA: transketolase C-terminal domain-containing protein [Polyangiaceae bacterium]|jgi:transketolase|nr:transketolase C-terminal domain-containing protein [Polyangiaceae bacterium]